MSTVRLYATALLLGLWAVLWGVFEVRGDAAIGVALTTLCGAAVVSELERARRRRERR
jgi:hypothetical protein